MNECTRWYELLTSEEGTSATEYAVMLGLIVLVAVGAISGIGTGVSDTFTSLDTSVDSALP